MKYKRILLKLSGESLMGDAQYGIDNNQVLQYAKDIKSVYDAGIEIAIVVGGGNIFRGLSAEKSGMDRAQADSAVRAVLITGAPDCFSAGNDMVDFLKAQGEFKDSAVARFMHAIYDFHKPSLAAVKFVNSRCLKTGIASAWMSSV